MFIQSASHCRQVGRSCVMSKRCLALSVWNHLAGSHDQPEGFLVLCSTIRKHLNVSCFVRKMSGMIWMHEKLSFLQKRIATTFGNKLSSRWSPKVVCSAQIALPNVGFFGKLELYSDKNALCNLWWLWKNCFHLTDALRCSLCSCVPHRIVKLVLESPPRDT